MRQQKQYRALIEVLRDRVSDAEDVAYSGVTHRTRTEGMAILLAQIEAEVQKNPICSDRRRLQARAVKAYRTERQKRSR